MDNLYNHPEIYEAEYAAANLKDVEFWGNLQFSGRLVELGSGSGRLIPIWQTFPIEIIAVEAAEKMRLFCEKKFSNSSQLKVIAADICDFQLDEKVDHIVLPLNMFNHLLGRKEQLACLNCCRQALKSSGQIIFDIFNPASWQPWSEPKVMREFTLHGNIWQRWESHYLHPNEESFILSLAYRNTQTEEILQLGVPLRKVGRFEIQWLLEQTGFKIKTVWSNYEHQTFSNFSPHMIVVAH